ncbi:MAG: hypothetical protein EBT07_17220 [Actinobacteria bacterium]|nr:hypothetical protein [Actinomycetota bacterium]
MTFAGVPPHAGGLPESFNSTAGSVRDLEREGVLPISAAQSYGSAQFSNATALIELQQKHRELRNRLDRIEEIVASLLKKSGVAP